MEAGSGEVLERRVHTGERPEEQPRGPARGSREFMASVWSSGRCQGVQRGTGAVVHSGSMMASTAVQWQRRGLRRKKGSLHWGEGDGAPFIAGGGGWQRWRELWVEQWQQRSHGHGKEVAAMFQMRSAWAAPLFG
jgi:hypothetical protein